MKMQFVTITPAKAEKLLQNNHANRSLSHKTVEALARDMKNGKWKSNTGTAISLSKDGEVLDGQHRLAAIITSGIDVPMWVCFECGSDGVYDRVRTRSVRDQLNMSRCDLPSVMRNNSFLGMIRYITVGNGKMTAGDAESYIDNHFEELSKFVDLGVFATTKAKITICSVYVALYWAFLGGVPGDKITDFMEILRTGMASCPEEYPIIAYRNYLLEYGSSRSCTDETIRLCQGALKKYITGSCLKRVYDPKKLLWSSKERRIV